MDKTRGHAHARKVMFSGRLHFLGYMYVLVDFSYC